MKRVPFLSVMFVLTTWVACGSASRDGVFLMTPESPATPVGSKLSLTAQPLVDLAEEPEWEIQELQGGAFLRSKGLGVTYVAPAVAGTYHLVIKGRKPEGAPLRQVVPVLVQPQVTVEASERSVSPGGRLQLSAKVRGTSRQDVAWSVEEEAGGRIDADGVYTAAVRPGIYHVRAEAAGFPGAEGRLTVRVE